jgi:adenosine kinase
MHSKHMNIVLTGSVAYDYLMTFPGYFRDHFLTNKIETISLSFLVDKMVKLRGGIAPNIAYTLALLGEHPRLLAAVGEDFEEYRAWLESKGVDTSGARLIPGVFTASCFTNTTYPMLKLPAFSPGRWHMRRSFHLRIFDVMRQRWLSFLLTIRKPCKNT